MAVAAHPVDNSPAAAAEGRTAEIIAKRMFVLFGKEAAYAEACAWEAKMEDNESGPFWQDVASLIDAMSPCAHECGRPGIQHYNDVFACEACGERILGGMR